MARMDRVSWVLMTTLALSAVRTVQGEGLPSAAVHSPYPPYTTPQSPPWPGAAGSLPVVASTPPGAPVPDGTSAFGRGGAEGAGASPTTPNTPATPGAATPDSSAGGGAFNDAAAAFGSSASLSSGLGGRLGAPQGALNMIGDLGPILTARQTTIPTPPTRPQPFPAPTFPRPPSPRLVT